MATPACTKCGSRDFMMKEDSGPTFEAWRCAQCDLRKEQKNDLGKTLPFVGPVLGLFMLLIGMPPDVPSGN